MPILAAAGSLPAATLRRSINWRDSVSFCTPVSPPLMNTWCSEASSRETKRRRLRCGACSKWRSLDGLRLLAQAVHQRRRCLVVLEGRDELGQRSPGGFGAAADVVERLRRLRRQVMVAAHDHLAD